MPRTDDDYRQRKPLTTDDKVIIGLVLAFYICGYIHTWQRYGLPLEQVTVSHIISCGVMTLVITPLDIMLWLDPVLVVGADLITYLYTEFMEYFFTTPIMELLTPQW